MEAGTLDDRHRGAAAGGRFKTTTHQSRTVILKKRAPILPSAELRSLTLPARVNPSSPNHSRAGESRTPSFHDIRLNRSSRHDRQDDPIDGPAPRDALRDRRTRHETAVRRTTDSQHHRLHVPAGGHRLHHRPRLPRILQAAVRRSVRSVHVDRRRLLDVLLLFVQMRVHALRRPNALRRRHGLRAKLRRAAAPLGGSRRPDAALGSHGASSRAALSAGHTGPAHLAARCRAAGPASDGAAGRRILRL